ncbi:MAG: 50S ribosomal protein L13 [Deltaproteobacteria bacterium]|nr:50S ribosomal protein L13 [Deltaproteobacteria bacterium]
MRTYSAKPAEALAARGWWIVDAKGQPLGRLATRVAGILRGKTKATFTPHVDTGDFVVVINAAQVKLTGRKPEQKAYHRHTGRPGSLRTEIFRDLVQRRPEVPIETAVRGMLPKSPLGRGLLNKLKVYPTADHPHAAQQPKPLAL